MTCLTSSTERYWEATLNRGAGKFSPPPDGRGAAANARRRTLRGLLRRNVTEHRSARSHRSGEGTRHRHQHWPSRGRSRSRGESYGRNSTASPPAIPNAAVRPSPLLATCSPRLWFRRRAPRGWRPSSTARGVTTERRILSPQPRRWAPLKAPAAPIGHTLGR